MALLLCRPSSRALTMINQAVYLTFGGIGVSLAGFASLLLSLAPSDTNPRLLAWRIRYIVTGGFVIAFASFAVVAFAEMSDNPATVVRLSIIGLSVASLLQSWTYRTLDDPDVFRHSWEKRAWVVGNALSWAILVANLIMGSPTLMLATWVLLVAAPMTIFINVLAERYETSPASESARTD